MIYQYVSARIAGKLFAAHYIQDADREVYAYCIEIILSTAVTVLSTFVLSLLFHCVAPTFVFYLCFFASRILCGGYHAHHHLTCYLITLFDYGLFILGFTSWSSIKTEYRQFILWGMLLFSFLMIVLLAPVDHPNNPMSGLQKQKVKIICRIYIIVFVCAASVLTFYFSHVFFLPASVFGVFTAASALLPGKLDNKHGGGEKT